jgi:hypothetical protein
MARGNQGRYFNLELGVSPPTLECNHYSWDWPIRYDDKQYTDAWCNVTLQRVHVEIAVHIPSNVDGRMDNFNHGPGEGEKSDVVMCPLIEIMGKRGSRLMLEKLEKTQQDNEQPDDRSCMWTHRY